MGFGMVSRIKVTAEWQANQDCIIQAPYITLWCVVTVAIIFSQMLMTDADFIFFKVGNYSRADTRP